MLTFGILIIFALAAYGGMKRGFITQLIALLGYTVSFYISMVFYPSFSQFIELIIPYPSSTLSDYFYYFSGEETFNLDMAFYAALSLIIIMIVCYIVVRTIVYIVQPVTKAEEAFPTLNKAGGAIVSVIIAYVFVLMLLYLGLTLPLSFIQNGIRDNILVQVMIEHTPILSDMLYDLILRPFL